MSRYRSKLRVTKVRAPVSKVVVNITNHQGEAGAVVQIKFYELLVPASFIEEVASRVGHEIALKMQTGTTIEKDKQQ